MTTLNVGIRDLKAHLSEYIARARKGEEMIITDRGRGRCPHRAAGNREASGQNAGAHKVGMIDKGPMRYFPPHIRMTPGEKTSTDYVREQRR